MSRTRKMKRQMLKEWAKEGKKPAEEVARAARQEMRDLQKKAATFGLDILGATALTVMFDYGKLKDRSARMTTLLDKVNERYNALQTGKLPPDEMAAYQEFAVTFSERWNNYDDDAKEGTGNDRKD